MVNVIFNTLTSPEGIAFDSNGNLYLSSLISAGSLPGIPASQTAITKLGPDGTVLGQIPIGNLVPPRLEYSPELNVLFSLDENGNLSLFNADTLGLINQINLTSIPTDTSAIFDVAINGINSFGGAIQTAFATFGDLDTRLNGNILELYITGQSQAQAFPFVLKIDWQLGVGITDSQVILASSADALSSVPQSPRLSRGIAVNSQGVVVTTLPQPTPVQPLDFPVAFTVNFDVRDGLSEGEVPVILRGADIYSQGLTADAAGNFYFATNSVGSGQLGVAGEGALAVLSSDLSQYTFVSGIGSISSSFRDVAVNPTNNIPSTIVNTFNTGVFGVPADDLLVSFPEAIPIAAVADNLTGQNQILSEANLADFVNSPVVSDSNPNGDEIGINFSLGSTGVDNIETINSTFPIQEENIFFSSNLFDEVDISLI